MGVSGSFMVFLEIFSVLLDFDLLNLAVLKMEIKGDYSRNISKYAQNVMLN
jgi:hypothetical protein